MSIEINIVNKHLQFPRVNLKEPLESGFILISAEVDKKTSTWGESKSKKTLIKKIKNLLPVLREQESIIEVTLFKAALFPPGRNGGYLSKLNNKAKIHDKYDVALLIELKSLAEIEKLQSNSTYNSIVDVFFDLSTYHFIYKAENIRRMDSVDHKRKGVFLFNYFVAKHKRQNLEIWEYTAGWFENQTNLDNSTLFSSIEEKLDNYSVINHCRWDGFINVLPSLIFKKTFKTYVLDNFEANDVAAIPILYKLA